MGLIHLFRVLNGALFLLPLLLSVGCQSLRVAAPGPIIESPLVSGKSNKFGLHTSYRPAQGVEVTDNAGARPLDAEKPRLVEAGETAVGLIYAPAKPIDLRFETAIPGIFSLIAKWQFLGEPLDQGKKGNAPFAILGHIGSGSSSQKGDQKEVFGPGGYPWDGRVSMSTSGVGLMGGYQPMDELLLFAGYTVNRYWLRYDIKHEVSRDGTLPAAEYKGAQSGSASAMGLGVEFLFANRKGGVQLIGQHDYRIWEKSPDQAGWNVGGVFRFSFD